MAANDLTTLTVVKAWLSAEGTPPGNADLVLSRLITTVSAQILTYLQRATLLSTQYTDSFSGNGGRKYFLNQWPVTSVQSVTVDGIAVLPSSDGIEPGWILQQWNGYPPGFVQAVTLVGGYCFNRGSENVEIVYTAGYLGTEAWVIPATPYEVTVAAPQGFWAQDAGVINTATGVALTLVTGTPSAGQYAVALGVYTFAAADVGNNVAISYSYVPAAIDEACMSWVSERYKYRTRIGQRSQSIGGQTTNSFDTSDMPAYLKTQLQNYRSVLPI